MKVAIVGTSHPYRGGLASYNERLATEFQDQGHDVTIYTFTLQYPKILFPGKTQYSDEPAPKNLTIKRAINSINPINWVRVGNQLKKAKPDLVIVKYWLPFMGPCLGTILRRIRKNGHSKIITIIDNMIPHESRPGDTLFSKYFVKPVDGFVAMSETVLNDIKLFDREKPKILSPHPLFDNFGELISREKAIEKLNLNPDNRYILFFGLIRKYKGLDLLIEAFADQRFRDRDLKLIIAGEYYSDKKTYTDLIEKYELQDDITQVDKFIPDSMVKYYFCASDVVVQPYKSATQSGVTQIAYHFNKPMIVTDVGGLSELCPHEKVGYVVPIDAEKIAYAMLRFFDETDQKAMIQNIKQEKKKYSWGLLVDNILGMMQKI